VVTFNRTDLEFILTQIKMAEAGQPPVNVHLAFGLREVAGTNNNLVSGQEDFGASDQTFPRVTEPLFRTVTINIDGILFDSSNSSQANFLAIITGQYVGKDIAAVLSEGQTANGIFSNTISASVITSATPEPATMLISGFGLIALSIAGRRFRRNR